MIEGPISVSPSAVSWHDHYWNSLCRELEERGYLEDDEAVVSFDIHVEVERGVTVSNVETEKMNSAYE